MKKKKVEDVPAGLPKKEKVIVKVKHGGKCPWIIKYRGKETVKAYENDEIEFDTSIKEQLKALIEVLRIMNSGEGNREGILNTQVYIVKGSHEPMRYRRRFEIVSGFDEIPSTLKRIKYKASKYHTDAEKEAIVSLCPEYFMDEEVLYKVRR